MSLRFSFEIKVFEWNDIAFYLLEYLHYTMMNIFIITNDSVSKCIVMPFVLPHLLCLEIPIINQSK